ncbi:hypothetical protein HYU07_01195 [Candidatus Woesearchaeota archaeon]|nr:hypothetical protein [Candidatus Woesearchaeota archaeon]
MGFFQRLFSFGKKAELEEVRLEEAENWLDQKISERFGNFNNSIMTLFSDIKSKKEELKTNMTELEKAQLMNPNIPLKAKEVMEGNRGAYIRKLGYFLEQLALPNEKEYENILDFSSNFSSSLNEFGKNTSKNFYVLNEFFATDVKKIAQNVKEFELIVNDLRKQVERGPIGFGMIKGELKNIKEKIKLKKELNEKIKAIEIEIENIKNKIKNTEEELNAKQENNEFRAYKALEKEKDRISARIKEHKANFLNIFGTFEKALKKYERMAMDEAIAHGYLADPINTLIKDEEFRVLELLGKLSENIDGLDLKEDKKKRTLELIKKLDRDFFEKFLIELEDLENSAKMFDEKIKAATVMKEHAELKDKLNEFQYGLQKFQREHSLMREKEQDIDIEGFKNYLEREIKRVIGLGVRVVHEL